MARTPLRECHRPAMSKTAFHRPSTPVAATLYKHGACWWLEACWKPQRELPFGPRPTGSARQQMHRRRGFSSVSPWPRVAEAAIPSSLGATAGCALEPDLRYQPLPWAPRPPVRPDRPPTDASAGGPSFTDAGRSGVRLHRTLAYWPTTGLRRMNTSSASCHASPSAPQRTRWRRVLDSGSNCMGGTGSIPTVEKVLMSATRMPDGLR